MPVAKNALRLAAAIDEGRIEDIATGFIKGVERQGGGCETREEFETEGDDRSGLGNAGDLALRNGAAAPDGVAGNVHGALGGFLDTIFEANRSAPLVEHLQIVDRVRPAHAG